ncbi:MAG: HAD-IA family hydrolase [Oscillospiraceae bacterium]|nr:HAD-IA family hydrolase [Oscillospiraceae bacterium]
MQKPKMILFDYGQTLANEQKFDGVKGTEAVLRYATKNKYNRTAQEVQNAADRINDELGRFDPQRQHLCQVEVPTAMFGAYLYGSMGIEIALSPPEYDRIFWDAAAPAVPTDGIADFLAFLEAQNIRTGVISNIAYCGAAVEERIRSLLPDHNFAFIISTSEYMFRKPNRRIFDLALEKAGLPPEDVWYVGDNYNCDIVGAQNAGLLPVWYTGALRSPAQARDVLTITHWRELAQVILESKE